MCRSNELLAVGLIDYGMGNLKSVANAVEKIGCQPTIVSQPEALASYDALILPGVGAFGEAIATLRGTGLDQGLGDYYKLGRPLLGICLGMQLMCRSSEEGGMRHGLGWFDARIVRFSADSGLHIPQMGWNAVHPERPHKIFGTLAGDLDVYFLHSFYAAADNPEEVLGTTEYGVRYASILACDNLCAMQFHPEKSHHVGLQLMRNFLIGT